MHLPKNACWASNLDTQISQFFFFAVQFFLRKEPVKNRNKGTIRLFHCKKSIDVQGCKRER